MQDCKFVVFANFTETPIHKKGIRYLVIVLNLHKLHFLKPIIEIFYNSYNFFKSFAWIIKSLLCIILQLFLKLM